jgi:peptidoglycan/LPS O-acetylase OafA/YrhL
MGKVEDLRPLTSLRFVAAMMIVVTHAPAHFNWPWANALPKTLVHGVSFFFVLSGFILTHVYSSKPFPGYRRFVVARFARLWPVHIVALILLCWFIRSDSITFDGPGIFNKWATLGFNVALLHSAMPFTDYQFSWNSVSWSISTEVFFYLAFPLLLIDIRRTWGRKLLASVLVALAIYAGLRFAGLPADDYDIYKVSIQSATYANPFTRGFEFCLGMGAWAVWDKYLRRAAIAPHLWTFVEAVAIVLAVAWLWLGFMAMMPHVRPATVRILLANSGSCWIFALVIMILAAGHGAIGKMLSAPWAVFLGEISFAVYMVHQILMKAFMTWGMADILSAPIYFGSLFLLATAIHLLIERPVRGFITGRRAIVVAASESKAPAI